LNRHGRFDCVYRTGKLGQQIIAWRIDNPPMMLCNETGDHFPIGLESMNGGFFIVAHETTVAFDIGAEDSGELAFHMPSLRDVFTEAAPEKA
jgi:hypothetical protein